MLIVYQSNLSVSNNCCFCNLIIFVVFTEYTLIMYVLNNFLPEQHGCRFADDILNDFLMAF